MQCDYFTTELAMHSIAGTIPGPTWSSLLQWVFDSLENRGTNNIEVTAHDHIASK